MLHIHESDKPKGVADGESDSFPAIWCAPPLSSSLQAADSVVIPTKIGFHRHFPCSFPHDPLLSVDANALSFTHNLAPQ